MTIAMLIAMLVQYLPTIIDDISSVAATLALASNAVSKAQATGVVAHNTVHHSRQYPSQITVTVVNRTQVPSTPAQPR